MLHSLSLCSFHFLCTFVTCRFLNHIVVFWHPFCFSTLRSRLVRLMVAPALQRGRNFGPPLVGLVERLSRFLKRAFLGDNSERESWSRARRQTRHDIYRFCAFHRRNVQAKVRFSSFGMKNTSLGGNAVVFLYV